MTRVIQITLLLMTTVTSVWVFFDARSRGMWPWVSVVIPGLFTRSNDVVSTVFSNKAVAFLLLLDDKAGVGKHNINEAKRELEVLQKSFPSGL